MQNKFPRYYLITPDYQDNLSVFKCSLENSLIKGIRLIQLRSKNLSYFDYLVLAKKITPLVHEYKGKIVLNGPVELLTNVQADGIHLNSARLTEESTRPLGVEHIISVACHNQEQLKQAELIGSDIAVLSPIFATPSSPQGQAIGWENFKKLVNQSKLPIYALGGLQVKDYPKAKQCGAYGIAAKRGLWNLSQDLENLYQAE